MESDVFIISADTHKIGGAEQLQLFASIAGITFRSVYTPDELSQTVNQENKRNFIYIDTTGTSYQNHQMIQHDRQYNRQFSVSNFVARLALKKEIYRNHDLAPHRAP